MVDLALQFRGVDAPQTARSEALPQKVGDIATFWTKDLESNQNLQIESILVYRSDDLNMWVESGHEVAAEEMAAAANLIERRILPKNRDLFGLEWQPGIDGDPRINILHLREIGGVGAAYFWSGDEYVTAVNPFSNQREMLYVSLKNGSVGSDAYFSAIAHELQHLIQWHNDRNEDAWLSEGMSELASHVNGFQSGRSETYAAHTDIQLNSLSHERDVIAAHYAAASMFTIYFFDRFGERAIRALAQTPENGLLGVSQVLSSLDAGISANDLFADWLVANYLEGEERGVGIYQYRDLDIRAIGTEKVSRLPYRTKSSVSQYGADYFQLSRIEQEVTVVFTGNQQVNLIDADPHSGEMYWVSTPADESSMSLTRAFDLSGMDQASLTFWTWYDIEEGWDYGYVAVSSDAGMTWSLLETGSTTTENPEGNSFGPGFTGVSGDSDLPRWTKQAADLTEYAGRPILLRFQYVTDGAVQGRGFAIDDISIMELGYFDDAEQGDAGWNGEGFARTGKHLPQEFIVQLILLDDQGQQIKRLQLDEKRRGLWSIPMDNQHSEAILIVSGVTPITRGVAAYELELYR